VRQIIKAILDHRHIRDRSSLPHAPPLAKDVQAASKARPMAVQVFPTNFLAGRFAPAERLA